MTTPPATPAKKLVAFATGLLVIHGLLYAFWAAVIGPRHKATRSDQLWERAPQHVEVVFLGDSHPRSAIDPRVIGPRWVNLATGGEHYAKSYYRFKTIYERQPRKVDAVVIPLDPNGFTSWHAEAFAPEYVWGNYVDFMELGRLRDDRWGYAAKWAKARLFPYAGELRTLNQLRGRRFGFADNLASGRFDMIGPKARAFAALDAAEVHFGGADLMDPMQRMAFEMQIAWLDAQDIRVVALSYPLTNAYLDAIREQGDPRAVVQREIIDRLAEDHPEVVHLDYTDFYRGQPDLFADPHHLNLPGRRLFTREVERALREGGVLDPAKPGQ